MTKTGWSITLRIVAQAVLEKVAAADCPVQIVKVRVGVAGFPDFTPVDAELLAQLADHAVLGLAGQEHIQVDAVPCVDQKAQPPGRDLGFVAVGGNQQPGVIQAVDTDVPPMRKVNAGGRVKFVDRDFLHRTPGGQIFRRNALDFLRERPVIALLPAENMVQRLSRRLVFILMVQDHGIAALPEIVGGSPGGRLQRSGGFFLFLPPLCPRKGFMLKNQEETPGNGLPGTETANQPQIVLLKHPAVFVGFLGQLPAYRLHMAVDIRPFGQRLELHLHRRDFQVTDEGVNNVPLFLGAAEQKVDRDDLQNLYIAAVSGIYNAIMDFLYRNIIGQRVQRLHMGREESFELADLPLFDIHLNPVPALWQLLRFFRFRFSGPAWKEALFTARAVLVQNAAVAEITEKLEDKTGQAPAANANQREQRQRKGLSGRE